MQFLSVIGILRYLSNHLKWLYQFVRSMDLEKPTSLLGTVLTWVLADSTLRIIGESPKQNHFIWLNKCLANWKTWKLKNFIYQHVLEIKLTHYFVSLWACQDMPEQTHLKWLNSAISNHMQNSTSYITSFIR